MNNKWNNKLGAGVKKDVVFALAIVISAGILTACTGGNRKDVVDRIPASQSPQKNDDVKKNTAETTETPGQTNIQGTENKDVPATGADKDIASEVGNKETDNNTPKVENKEADKNISEIENKDIAGAEQKDTPSADSDKKTAGEENKDTAETEQKEAESKEQKETEAEKNAEDKEQKETKAEKNAEDKGQKEAEVEKNVEDKDQKETEVEDKEQKNDKRQTDTKTSTVDAGKKF